MSGGIGFKKDSRCSEQVVKKRKGSLEKVEVLRGGVLPFFTRDTDPSY
jgi:hypothetical protein